MWYLWYLVSIQFVEWNNWKQPPRSCRMHRSNLFWAKKHVNINYELPTFLAKGAKGGLRIQLAVVPDPTPETPTMCFAFCCSSSSAQKRCWFVVDIFKIIWSLPVFWSLCLVTNKRIFYICVVNGKEMCCSALHCCLVETSVANDWTLVVTLTFFNGCSENMVLCQS